MRQAIHQRVVALAEDSGRERVIASPGTAVQHIEIQDEVNAVRVSIKVDNLKFAPDNVRGNRRNGRQEE